MVVPVRTWTILSPSASISTVNQAEAFQDTFLKMKNLFVSGGWTVVSSSNGIDAGAGDYLTGSHTAAVELNTAGIGSWTVHRSPTGFTTGSIGRDQGAVYMLFGVDDNASPYTQVEIRMATEPYTGGSVSALPTTTGIEATMNANGDDIYGFTGATPTGPTAYMAYSNQGDIVFAVKESGRSDFCHLFLLLGNHTSNGGKGTYRFGLFNIAANNTDVITYTNLRSTIYWIGLSDGGHTADAPNATSTSWDLTNLTNGLDYNSKPFAFPLDLLCNLSTRGRFMGTFPDLWCAAPNGVWAAVDDDDNGHAQVKRCAGDLWLLMNSGSNFG